MGGALQNDSAMATGTVEPPRRRRSGLLDFASAAMAVDCLIIYALTTAVEEFD
jgi:hypothetical protein